MNQPQPELIILKRLVLSLRVVCDLAPDRLHSEHDGWVSEAATEEHVELDQLILLLAQIVSQLKSKTLKFNLRLIVIDSLSSLFSGIPTKQNQYYFSLVKELLFYLKTLTKKYFISVIYTNNTKDSMVSRVTELKNLVGEPLSWAVDKQIYAQRNEEQTNYVVVKH